MIDDAGVMIFLFGNKLVDGEVVHANGMLEEFYIARDTGKYIIPISSTGYVTEAIYKEVKSDLESYWYLQDSLDVLEKETNPKNVIDEVNAIIERIRRRV